MKLVWKIVVIVAVVLLVLGIALIAVSLFTGGSLESIRNNVALTNYEQSFPDAAPHTLEIHVGAGRLYILPGEELRVEAKNVQDQGFVCTLEEDVLTVREDWSASWSDNLSRWMTLRHSEPEVYVYLPEGFSARQAEVQVSAGTCRVEGLAADSVRLGVSAGSLEVQGLTAGQTELKISAGNVDLDGLDTQALDVRLSAGAADIRGSAALSCLVDVSAGAVELELSGAPADYTALIQAGAGSIHYDGVRYSMETAHVGQGAGVMELSGSAGSIRVGFTG